MSETHADMPDEPAGGLATVAELMNCDEVDISGPVFCPACGDCDTLIGVRGEITAFELLSCPGCGVELHPEVAVFVSGSSTSTSSATPRVRNSKSA